MSEELRCDLPCLDTNRDFVAPRGDFPLSEIKMIMVSESPPQERSDYFYEEPKGSFFRTTQAAFGDAGFPVSSYEEITRLGVYLTTALKCSKRGRSVGAKTLEACSHLLEKEIGNFPNVRVIMCMGDRAIRTVNYMARRRFGAPVIPSGSTYKTRKGTYRKEGVTYFPSYTQTGPSFDIEKSKRRMIAEDIARAMSLL